jgi:hypothetical protein
MEILVDNQPIICGKFYDFANPAIEGGIVYARVLLEFLGISAPLDKSRLIPIIGNRKGDDDVGIERFKKNAVSLSRVTVDEALNVTSDPDRFQRALLGLITHADKAIVHLTEGPPQDDETRELLAFGCLDVNALVCRFLYDRLDLGAPRSRISLAPKAAKRPQPSPRFWRRFTAWVAKMTAPWRLRK